MYGRRHTILPSGEVRATKRGPHRVHGKEPYKRWHQKTILVADDDASIRSLLKQLLVDEGFAVQEASTGIEVVEKVKESSPDLVIMDVRMPELDGIEALSRLKGSNPKTAVLIMTAFGSSNAAIRAMELGAFDYITKPFELEKISHSVKRVLDYQDLTQEVEVLRDEISSLVQTERIVGNSPAMQEVYKTVGKVAKADATVLITGESGTGKELVAEALHFNSNRRSGPLVKVSCAALPETLLEAELFGHEKGSFTGAMAQRRGRFEMADKGTIFLDEIGEMSVPTQTKLLRVLQERKIERIGSNLSIKVDIRIVCATNKDLQKLVEQNKFRDDLYYRLNVINIHMPPLRERKEDIPSLVEHFLAKHRYSATAQPAADQRGGPPSPHGIQLAGQRPGARERRRARGRPLPGPDHHQPRAAVRRARGRRGRG